MSTRGDITRIYQRISQVPEGLWLEPHTFLRRSYLESVEQCCSGQVDTCYAIRMRGDRALAGAVLHQLRLSDASLFPAIDTQHPLYPVLTNAGPLSALVCGNLLSSGPFGHWSSATLATEEFIAWLASLTLALRQDLGVPDEQVLLVLKDVSHKPLSPDMVRPIGFQPCDNSPTMSLELSRDWLTIDDYVGSLRGPYRREYRIARERLGGVTRREMSARDIANHSDRLDALYDQVLDRSHFVPLRKNARCLATLVQRLPQECSVLGYFEKDKLLAFNTRFFCGRDFESHYFGMDYGVNLERSLYRNILYDDIEAAIARRSSRIHFGRCSEESKNAMGAQPIRLTSLVRAATEGLTDLVIASARQLGTGNWPRRHPFRVRPDTSSEPQTLSAS